MQLYLGKGIERRDQKGIEECMQDGGGDGHFNHINKSLESQIWHLQQKGFLTLLVELLQV